MRFRTRSSSRDEHTDTRRLDAIAQAIKDAIRDIDGETAGLETRLKKARDSAATLAGNEPFEHADRDSETERQLSEAENAMSLATKRIAQLKAQREHLQRVLEMLGAK
jgi:prefoldin subunit 5